MLYKLSGTPTVETHAENIIHLFVRGANGAPVPGAHVKVWAGPPPTGLPAYWQDDDPSRATGPSGMLEFIVMPGAMTDTRDYWMQVLAQDGTPQSDPVQFHFPQGATIWITAALTSGEAGPALPVKVEIDPRLAPMHVTVQPIQVAPDQPYWKIVAVRYQDENESGGNHNVYCTVLDELGVPAIGVPIRLDWQGREPGDTPSTVSTDGNGNGNVAIWAGQRGWRPEEGPGPYTVWVGDPDLRGNEPTHIRGEKLVGMGLPMNRHVNFIVTWQKSTGHNGNGEGGNVEQAIQSAAGKLSWMPINTDGALYKYAMAQNLGYPQTDEFQVTVGSDTYVAQVYNLGIVYVKKGDWGNCHWIKKP